MLHVYVCSNPWIHLRVGQVGAAILHDAPAATVCNGIMAAQGIVH